MTCYMQKGGRFDSGREIRWPVFDCRTWFSGVASALNGAQAWIGVGGLSRFPSAYNS